MHNNYFDDIIAIISGIAVSFLSIFLRFNWEKLIVEMYKTGEVLWLGIVGGVGGYLGKKIIEKIYQKKKNIK